MKQSQLFLFFIVLTVFSAIPLQAKTSLGNIRAFIDKDYNEFVTELNFSGAVDLSKIKINHSKDKIEIKIPGVKTEKKSASLNIDDKEVSSIKVKRDKKAVSISLLFSNKINGNDFKGYTRLEKDGQLVRVSLKRHSYLVKQSQIKTEQLKPVSLSFEKEDKKSDRDIASLGQQDKNKLSQLNMDQQKESEIPVLAAKTSKVEPEKGSLISRAAMSLGIIACFSIGLIFFLKWWSKNHKPNQVTNKIRVLTQHHLGPKKSLAIIRVAGEAILIGVTDQNISHIKTLSLLDDEIPESVPRSFNAELNENFRETEQNENFTYGDSIKNTIANRLKGLKS